MITYQKGWDFAVGSVGIVNTRFSVARGQVDYESRIRNSDIEYGAYFDANGNILAEGRGNRDEISFDAVEINHNVEQRVWRNEEVNFTHNHPENTIFSTNDIEAFEDMENHSIRAVLPNGKSYTLIREQPRTSREWVFNPRSGEYERTFEPKKIAPAYDREYSKIYDNQYRQIRRDVALTPQQRQAAITKLDSDVTKHMSEWLRKNARRYGYSYEET